MTVQELTKALGRYPPDMNVKVCIMPTIANAEIVDTSVDIDTNITSVVIRANSFGLGGLDEMVAKANECMQRRYTKEVVRA